MRRKDERWDDLGLPPLGGEVRVHIPISHRTQSSVQNSVFRFVTK